ncbi:MAG TPA: ABC transporter [Clostridiales bacterium UBA8960]|nr:ABC transporter [Clostridiales bacterium UBA8960]
MVVVGVQNIKFSYAKDEVLKRISFDVQEGKFVSIIGPNGSGKTTLLKNICRLLSPSEGQIEIRNRSLKQYKAKSLAKTIAVVHQGASSAFDFNVGEVVLMGRYPHLKRLESESMKDMTIAETAMHQTETFHLREKTLHSISGGERQRVMIARALAQEPELLLLDEPISHLDIKFQLEILKLCKSLNETKGLTILTTLHDINLASRFSDVIIMMKNGNIHMMGTPNEVVNAENIKAVYDVDVLVVEKPYPMIIPV